MSHVKSIEINRLVNKTLSHQLRGTELQVLQKLLLCLPVAGAGHDLGGLYTMSIGYTARVVGRGKESVRQAIEALQARNILLINQQTWEGTQDKNGNRKKTGAAHEITLSEAFKNFVLNHAKGHVLPWIFHFSQAFKAKKDKLVAKAKAAKEKFLKSRGIEVPKALEEAKNLPKTIKKILFPNSADTSAKATGGQKSYVQKWKEEKAAAMNKLAKDIISLKNPKDVQAMFDYYGDFLVKKAYAKSHKDASCQLLEAIKQKRIARKS